MKVTYDGKDLASGKPVKPTLPFGKPIDEHSGFKEIKVQLISFYLPIVPLFCPGVCDEKFHNTSPMHEMVERDLNGIPFVECCHSTCSLYGRKFELPKKIHHLIEEVK